MGRSINEIINYRFSLIRGKFKASVNDVQMGGRIFDNLQELAMGANPTETEVAFTKKPRLALSLDDNSQPFGPSAPLLFFKTSNINVDRRVEKAFSDGDLKASEAVMKLYRERVMVTRIKRPFSLGMFEIGRASCRERV